MLTIRRSLAFVATSMAIAAAVSYAGAKEDKEDKGEVKIKFAESPAAVQKTLSKEAAGAAIGEVEKETKDGKIVYEADVKLNGGNYEIKVAEDGTLLKKKLDEKSKEKNESEEVVVKLSDCPAAAKKAILKETGSAKIDTVDKETKRGRTFYEADATIDGRNYEIAVTADGTLLWKKLDEEDKAGDKGHDDKDSDEKGDVDK